MNILITGAWQDAKENIKTIEEMGHTVSFLQYEKDKLPCTYEWVEGVICNGLFLYHPIEQFINLKYIQLTSAGYDRVPMDYVKVHNIAIYNARGVYSIPMAEYALSGVLQLYKKTAFFYENQKQRKWIKNREIIELNGRTVCILGCGSVGTECAKKFKAFGCKVIGLDKYIQINNSFDALYQTNQMNVLLPIVDILILTVPLTEETKHLVNSQTFSNMKENAVLVNISRGVIVETDALINALETKLYGAVLDVFEEEPLPEDHPLWSKDNILITPHNSFVGNNNNERLTDVILHNLESYR